MVNASDWLERYLQAVGRYLPEATRLDTLAELRANLLETMEARAEELGRPLEFADVAAILKEHGKPSVVASRYLPQRSLIGPAVFPLYTLTLARVIPLVAFISLVANVIAFLGSGHETWAEAFASIAGGLWYSLLVNVIVVTAIFATAEWATGNGKVCIQWNEWDPAKLPALKAHAEGQATARSAARKVIDLAVHCLWMAYLLWAPWHPFWIIGPGVFYLDSLNVALAPVWHMFYPLLIVVLSAQLVVKLVAFFPVAERRLELLKLGTDGLGLIPIGVLAAGSTYFVAGNGAPNLQTIAAVNHGVSLAFKIVLVLAIVALGKDGWSYARPRMRTKALAF